MKLCDLLFPPKCFLCNCDIDEGPVCGECKEKLLSKVKARSKSFDVDGIRISGTYVFDYNDKDIQKLLFALKKDADNKLFCFAAELYKKALPKDFCGVVTGVPRRRINARLYGYDHVNKPIKIMCGNDENLLYEKLLKRKGMSREQKKLSAEQRKINASGKFSILKKDIQTNILLVDDVVTTGSTISFCARQIINANPKAKIYFAFLAAKD